MKKLNKLVLSKTNIDQNDILKKKQMKNLWGGRGICTWCCTVDPEGTCGSGAQGQSYAASCDECWRDAEFHCSPYTQYGIWIQCS